MRENVPLLLTLTGLPVATVVSTIVNGDFEILWLEAAAAATLIALLGAPFGQMEYPLA
jgi:hypothetical protein